MFLGSLNVGCTQFKCYNHDMMFVSPTAQMSGISCHHIFVSCPLCGLRVSFDKRGPVATVAIGAVGYIQDQFHFTLSFLTGTDDETFTLIMLRAENDHLFTGKRHRSKKAWERVTEYLCRA